MKAEDDVEEAEAARKRSVEVELEEGEAVARSRSGRLAAGDLEHPGRDVGEEGGRARELAEEAERPAPRAAAGVEDAETFAFAEAGQERAAQEREEDPSEKAQ